MPKFLPEIQNQINSYIYRAKSLILQFPNIFRFIPEKDLLTEKNINLLKISVSCTISVLLLGATLSQGFLLIKNREYLEKITSEREKIKKEVMYWEKTAHKYKNYPDIYLKMASLEYRLGNTQTAKEFLEKALAINPQTEQARVLGEKISR